MNTEQFYKLIYFHEDFYCNVHNLHVYVVNDTEQVISKFQMLKLLLLELLINPRTLFCLLVPLKSTRVLQNLPSMAM